MSDALPAPTYAPPFWLSHHRFEDRHRCFHIGGFHLCSRCLATYPVLFAALAMQLHRPMAPVSHPWDRWILFALAAPALLDWGLGQLSSWKGRNALRFATGLLLGCSLGRALYIHMRHPGTPLIYAYGLALMGFAAIVWGLRQVLGSGRE